MLKKGENKAGGGAVSGNNKITSQSIEGGEWEGTAEGPHIHLRTGGRRCAAAGGCDVCARRQISGVPRRQHSSLVAELSRERKKGNERRGINEGLLDAGHAFSRCGACNCIPYASSHRHIHTQNTRARTHAHRKREREGEEIRCECRVSPAKRRSRQDRSLAPPFFWRWRVRWPSFSGGSYRVSNSEQGDKQQKKRGYFKEERNKRRY